MKGTFIVYKAKYYWKCIEIICTKEDVLWAFPIATDVTSVAIGNGYLLIFFFTDLNRVHFIYFFKLTNFSRQSETVGPLKRPKRIKIFAIKIR